MSWSRSINVHNDHNENNGGAAKITKQIIK